MSQGLENGTTMLFMGCLAFMELKMRKSVEIADRHSRIDFCPTSDLFQFRIPKMQAMIFLAHL